MPMVYHVGKVLWWIVLASETVALSVMLGERVLDVGMGDLLSSFLVLVDFGKVFDVGLLLGDDVFGPSFVFSTTVLGTS